MASPEEFQARVTPGSCCQESFICKEWIPIQLGIINATTAPPLVQVVLGIHEGWTLPLQIVTVAIKHLHTRILPINYEHPARGPQRDAVR